MSSNIEDLPLPRSFPHRTIGEVNGRLEEGDDVTVHDRNQACYPTIVIDPTRIFRTAGIHFRPSDIFLDNRSFSMSRRVFRTLWNFGVMAALNLIVTENSSESEDGVVNEELSFEAVVKKTMKKLQFLLIFICRQILSLYLSIYPYGLLSADEQCQLFSQSLKWNQEIVKVLKWHPNQSKCGICLVNDDVHIYSRIQGNDSHSQVGLLKHSYQKNVVDLVWKPNAVVKTTTNAKPELVLLVVCQSVIVIWDLTSVDFASSKNKVPLSFSRVIDSQSTCGFLVPPLMSLTYDSTGKSIMFVSPKSSSVVIMKDEQEQDDKNLFRQQQTCGGTNVQSNRPEEDKFQIIKYWHPFGHGNVRLLWSPDKSRLVVCPASCFIRVFEKTTWKERVWRLPSSSRPQEDCFRYCQSCVWSQPDGRHLLVSLSGDSSIYDLAFYDSATPGSVGGEKELVKILDLSEYELPNGQTAGGVIQNMVWDQHAERLVVSFRDNPEYLAAFKTSAKMMLVVEPLGIIHGEPGERAVSMDFDLAYSRGSLLSVVWSSGFVSHIPFAYDATVKKSHKTSTPTTRSLTQLCVSPLLKSPAASPISSNTSQTTYRGLGRHVIPDITFTTATPHQAINSGSLLLASDSVITPRKPHLFSCRSVDEEDKEN